MVLIALVSDDCLPFTTNMDGTQTRGHNKTAVFIKAFAKVFDKVPLVRHIYKLDNYGIRGSNRNCIN